MAPGVLPESTVNLVLRPSPSGLIPNQREKWEA